MHNVQESHAHFAHAFNLETWQLLQKENRTPEEEERMIGAAHASHCHWQAVGGVVEAQRGLWLVSHVYAELGLGEPSLRYAHRCLQLTDRHPEQMQDFDRAYAFEGMARAAAVAGDGGTAARYRALAGETGATIANGEDRAIFTGDLDGGNWGVLQEGVG